MGFLVYWDIIFNYEENAVGDGLVPAAYSDRWIVLSSPRVFSRGDDGILFNLGIFCRQVLVLESVPAGGFFGYSDIKVKYP